MRTHVTRRPGGVSLYLILVLPLLLLIMGVALYTAQLAESRTRLQNSADAAALAAALALVDDRALLGGEVIPELLDASRQEAIAYHRANSHEKPVPALRPDPDNDPEGDITFGLLSEPRSKEFVLADIHPSGDSPLWERANAVRVNLNRSREQGRPVMVRPLPLLGGLPTDVDVWATAMLDRQVVGFVPAMDLAVPLVPIALFSAPAGTGERRWEWLADPKTGSDRVRYDRETNEAIPDEQDGLPEFLALLGVRGADDEQGTLDTCVLQFGTEDLEGVARQVSDGVSAADLDERDGRFELEPGGPTEVPGLADFDVNTDGAEVLLRALEALAESGRVTVFPLYEGYTADGQVAVSGFVAARVLAARRAEGPDRIEVALQPGMLSTVTALTEPRHGEGATPMNRYVCKVRLVE